MSPGFLAVLLLVAAVVVAVKAIRVVPQLHTAVVRRGRSGTRALGPGLSTIVPFLDTVVSTVDMREQTTTVSHEPIISSEHWVLLIDWRFYHSVTDPVRAVEDPPEPLGDALAREGVLCLRDVVGRLAAEDVEDRRHAIDTTVRERLDATVRGWGASVARVEITAVHHPPHPDDHLELRTVSHSRSDHHLTKEL